MGAVKKAGRDINQAVVKGTGQVGEAVAKPVRDVSKEVRKAGRDINVSVDKATKQTGDVFSDPLNKAGSNTKKLVETVSGFEDIAESVGDITNIMVGGRLRPRSDSQPDTDAPTFALDVQAAQRRKQALALRRGLRSTRRADQEDTGSVLQAGLSGKTKLGQ